MQRTIIAFEQDDAGDWRAVLECGHRQHVRHQPPLVSRPWVLTPEGRASRIGHALNCVKCDADGSRDGAMHSGPGRTPS